MLLCRDVTGNWAGRMGIFDQTEDAVRCEWGAAGLMELLPHSDAIVIVDVLSFTTCVAIAASAGATIFPSL